MRQAKNPTRAQRLLIKSMRLNSENWLVVTETPEVLVIRHRHSDREREIRKPGKEKEV